MLLWHHTAGIVYPATPVEKPNWRARKVLKRLETCAVIYLYQLPREVSYTTMDGLVQRGIVEVVNGHTGRYSRDYGWRLIAAPCHASEDEGPELQP